MATVSLKNLVKKYGSLEVVHAINLDVADREFVALVGPSGCGKSTTLRMIAGLRPSPAATFSSATEDMVNNRSRRSAQHLDGVPVLRALSAHDRCRKHGLRLKIAGKDPAGRDRQRVQQAAEDAGTRRPSRPQARRAVRRPAPARGHGPGHCPHPEVFLFDEPLSNLDAKLGCRCAPRSRSCMHKVGSRP
jgi:multiple sugar transport system ATP-binding protein